MGKARDLGRVDPVGGRVCVSAELTAGIETDVDYIHAEILLWSRMRWKVRLSGDELGLKDLSDSFDDDPAIFEEDNEFYLWSSRFEGVNEADEVRETAENIVQAIHNFGERDSLRIEELEASHITEMRDDGSKNVYVFGEPASLALRAGPVRVTTSNGDKTKELYLPADRTYKWTQLALEDETVGKFVGLLEQGDSWVNLYRIYEFMQNNIKSEDNIIAQGWWSAGEKSLFKHTANSREAIGDEARHGPKVPAPENPMTHAEAKRLIETLIDHWLRHRKQISTSAQEQN